MTKVKVELETCDLINLRLHRENVEYDFRLLIIFVVRLGYGIRNPRSRYQNAGTRSTSGHAHLL